MSTILGTLGPVEQPVEFSFSQRNGGVSTRTWRGSYDYLTTLAYNLKVAGWSYTLRQDKGDIWTLTATIGGDQDGDGVFGTNQQETDSWELFSNRVEKDFLESADPLVLALTAGEITEIRYYLQNPPNGGSRPPFTDTTNMNPVWDLLVAGVKSVEIEAAVLRHTKIVPPNQASVIDYSNTGKIFTVSQLRSKEGCPPDFLIPLDQFSSGTTSSSNITQRWGWKKNLPQLSLTNFSRREVRIEYAFGLWPSIFTAVT